MAGKVIARAAFNELGRIPEVGGGSIEATIETA